MNHQSVFNQRSFRDWPASSWHSLAMALVIVMTCTLPAASFAQLPGSLDTSFGTAGKAVSIPIGSKHNQLTAAAIQPDGKIVLAGLCIVGTGVDFCVARLNIDGLLDVTFDGPSGVADGTVLLPIGTGDDFAFALALQPDGKILLSGYCQNGAAIDFCVARLNPNGSFDTSFVGPSGTGNGKVMFSVGSGTSYTQASAIALQPDGKILLAGECRTGSNSDFCVARLNANGSFDPSFNGPSGTGGGRFALAIGPGFDALTAMALQSDGKIVLAGFCANASLVREFCIARLNVDGTLDASFNGPAGNGNGKFLLSINGGGDNANALVVQPDGKLVLVGQCLGSVVNICVTRLNPDGAYDQSFDGPGGNGNGKFLIPIGSSYGVATAVAQQPDGKIVIAGYCYGAGNEDFCTARLNGDGSLDATFAGPAGNALGKFLLPIGLARDEGTAIVLQPDGKIVLAGYCVNGSNPDFCAARLNGGPFSARNCSLDIDGDGSITTATDVLINARVALGFRGAAVLSGISFSADAKRNTWPLIRDYLFSQCGLAVY